MDEKQEAARPARHVDSRRTDWAGLDVRPGTAFPALTDEMVERLKAYGYQRTFPAHSILYTYGDVDTVSVWTGWTGERG